MNLTGAIIFYGRAAIAAAYVSLFSEKTL